MEIAVQRAPDADADLVRRHQAGDRAAFDEIVARHKRAVYLTARRLLGAPAAPFLSTRQLRGDRDDRPGRRSPGAVRR